MKKSKISIFGLSIVCALCFIIAFTLLPNGKTYAQAIGIEDKAYCVGNYLDLENAQISHGGENYSPAGKTVTAPDGTVYNGNNILLNDYGYWIVNLTTSIGGEDVVASKEIKVVKNVITSTGNKATATYEYNDKVGANGLSLSIPIGETVELNSIIDVSKSSISKSFIDFSFIPTEVGKPDAYAVYMKLTDIYDENNWIIVRMQNWSDMGTWADAYIYMDAKAPNQEYTSTVDSSEDFYYAKRDQNTGKGWYTAAVSMVGRNQSGGPSYHPVKFYFDYKARGMVTNLPGLGSQFVTSGGAKYMCDFDDPEFFDPNKESLWNGFTTGEVRVSFYGGSYNGATVNLFISNLLDTDLEQAAKGVEDYASPEIKVDLGDLETTPFAVIGKEYKVFNTTVFDADDGIIGATAKLYFDYDGAREECDIINGSFVPDKVGVYSIIYTSTDRLKNKSIKRLDVECLDNEGYLKLSFNQVNVMNLGETVKVVDDVSVINANGNYSIDVKVFKGAEIYDLADDYVFTPSEPGQYTVYVYATDYVCTSKQWFPLSVEVEDKPVFKADAVMEKYYVKDAQYKLSPLDAVYYSDEGAINVPCSVYYSLNNGDRILAQNMNFIANQAGSVDIIYVAEYNGKSSERIYSASVIDIGYGDSLKPQNMFVDLSNTITKTASEDNMEISTDKNVIFGFVNKLQAVSFSMTFNVVASKNNFEKFNVYMTDSVDESIRVKFSFTRNADKVYMYINEQSRVSFNASFDGTSNKVFMLNYDNSDYSVGVEAGIYGFIYNTIYGEEFNGFTSNYVNVEFEFEGVSGDAAINSINLNGMSFFDIDLDIVRPQILVDKKSGEKGLNEKIVLTPAIFADVVDPNVVASMKVSKNDGSFLSDINGVVLDGSQDPRKEYTVLLSSLGDYSVEYYAKDNSNKEISYSYGFKVIDNVAPKIGLLVVKNEYSLGDTVNIAKAVVSDNVGKPTLYKFILKPDSSMVEIGDSFVADQKGVYTIYYYAFDANHNSAVASYQIIVK